MPLEPWVWSTLLMFVGLFLIILEVFIPSGGILGTLAVTSILSSIGMAFYYSGPRTGATFFAVALAGVPLAVAGGLALLPRTPVGRRLLLSLPTEEDVLPDNEELLELQSLVGKAGVARSPMLPSGAIMVDGKVFDAMSEGMAIECGQPVRVVTVRMNRLIVRPVSKDETSQSGKNTESEEDILSKPIDSLGLDPFKDPLA